MKKILSFLLSVLLLISMLSVTAFAEDEIGTTMQYIVQDDGTAMISYFDSLATSYDIPAEIDGYTVTAIGNKAFYGCHTLCKVTVPDTVLTIGDKAFDSCKRLNTITLGNSVTSIGFRAFGGCKALKTITLPDSLISIGNNAFSGCHKLSQINIPASVTSVGNYAFTECINMQSLSFGNGDMTIGEFAFSWCLKIEDVILGSNVKSIGAQAFVACDSLKSVTIENPECVIDDSVDTTIPSNATIYGYSDSTAQQYASKYGNDFVSLDEKPVGKHMLGDVDNDGYITIMDANYIQRHLAKITILTDEQLSVANTDKDNEISILDATQIQRYLAKFIDEF